MNLIPIDESNIDIARKIQNELFQDDAYIDYLKSTFHITKDKYWLLEVDGHNIGISGLYSLNIDPTSAWLGWFGILPEYRRAGWGSLALILFEAEALRLGYKYSRIYTARNNNDVAKSFYQKNEYVEEHYYCPQDPVGHLTPLSIYSKSLYIDNALPAWANRNMHLFKTNLNKKLARLFPDKFILLIYKKYLNTYEADKKNDWKQPKINDEESCDTKNS